ncbi:unnamed protein product [Spirodela intermedia]|uniref:Uncharacterized protein n=1 Tax=Spirodela intermedia TaxID=51605 RepID=A0A7I8K203_SPIIN|nr:unnamed protein product [Spirodela intermedia]
MDAPEHRHVLEEGEERTSSHPFSCLWRSHEEEHHEKKSVLKKVKEKAKKIKETIGKRKHEHGEEHHRDDEEEEEEGLSEEETEEDAEVHGAPVYKSEAAWRFVASHEEAPPEEGVKLGAAAAGNLEEDTGAPKIGTEAPPVPGSDRSTGLPSAGEPEPGFISSFQAMSTEDGPKKEEEKKTEPSPAESPAATIRGEEAQTASKGETEQLQPQSEMSYKEKISSALVDKAVHAKEAAVSAAVESAEYGKKIAETMYEKTTGGGTAAAAPPPPPPQQQHQEVANEEQRRPSGAEGTQPADMWVSMKEYLAEKLSPGEEDRALCEVISETIQKRKEDEGDIREEGEEKPPPPPLAAAATPSGEKKSRKGVVGKIKGAVASVFGGPYSSQTRAREEATPSSKEDAPRLQESTN